MRYNPEEYVDLHCENVNIIRDSRIYVLPVIVQDYAVVELMVLGTNVHVQSQHHPIRYGKRCGSYVIVVPFSGIIDRNPKFIWNGKEWLINTFGTFIFAEMEINSPECVQ